MQHKDLIRALKDDYIAHFKAQGIADFNAKKRGIRVRPRHYINEQPTRCIMCRGGMEAAIGIVDTFEDFIPDLSSGMFIFA